MDLLLVTFALVGMLAGAYCKCMVRGCYVILPRNADRLRAVPLSCNFSKKTRKKWKQIKFKSLLFCTVRTFRWFFVKFCIHSAETEIKPCFRFHCNPRYSWMSLLCLSNFGYGKINFLTKQYRYTHDRKVQETSACVARELTGWRFLTSTDRPTFSRNYRPFYCTCVQKQKYSRTRKLNYITTM